MVEILEELGVYMGAEQNLAGASVPFEKTLNTFLNNVLIQQRSIQTQPSRLPSNLYKRMGVALLQAASAHLRAKSGNSPRWGIKNSRHIFILPILLDLFPGMKFVQIVRDGRDVAISANRIQVNNHFESLFAEKLGDDVEIAAIRLWSKVNVDAANWCRYVLGDRYIEIRYEDLCANPVETVRKLTDFVDLSDICTAQDIQRAASRIHPPESLEGWKHLPPERLKLFEDQGARGLAYFGYAPPKQTTLRRDPLKSDCVAIFGMHRGGTSATASLLKAAGYEFGSALMPPSADNSAGYWENEKLVAISERLQDLRGRHWSDCRPADVGEIPAAKQDALAVEAVALLRSEFNGSPRFAMKDPRMSILADFWIDSLKKANGRSPRIVLIVRNPGAVAASLASRDNLPHDTALWCWINHMQEAERATRRLERIVIDYDALVEHDPPTLEKLREFLGAAERLDAVGLQQDLRHHRPPKAKGGSRPYALAFEFYDLLRALTETDAGPARTRISYFNKKLSKAFEVTAPMLRQQENLYRLAADSNDTYRGISAMNLLHIFRQRDALKHLGDKVGRLRSAWQQDYEHHTQHKSKSPAYLGYQSWLDLYENSDTELDKIRSHIATLDRVPQFDLVIIENHQTDKEPTDVSVGKQQMVYPDRSLTLKAGDVSFDQEIAGFVQAGKSDYIAFHDKRFRLQTEALTRLLAEAAAFPDAALLYGDQDELGPDEARTKPWFKGSAWDQDEHLARNLVGGVILVRRADLAALPKLSPEEAAEPLFSIAAKITAADVDGHAHHVPCVLASRRASQDSNANIETHRRAAETLLPSSVSIEQGLGTGALRVRYPLPGLPPKVSIIIPTRDGGKHLARCLNGLRKQTAYPDVEVIIVDNGSQQPETLKTLSKFADSGYGRVVRHDAPFNYPQLNNIGREHATGDILCLLNDDIEPMQSDWLTELVSQALRPEIGATGALLFHENGTVQHAGVVVGMGGGPGAHFMRAYRDTDLNREGFCLSTRQYSAVTAACLVVRTEVYDELQGMDPTHLPVSYNDVDFCLRLRQKGYRVLFTPHARLWHLESATRGNDKRKRIERQWRRDVDIMRARWGDVIDEDPFLSPNLSDHHSKPTLAFPPRRSCAWRPKADWDAQAIRDSIPEMAKYSGTPVGLLEYQASELAVKCGDLPLANTLIKSARRKLPRDPRILLAAAVIAKQTGATEDALNTLRHLVKLHPNTVSGLYNLGNILLESGRLEEAVKAYKTAIELRPSHLGVAVNLSIALCKNDRAADSIGYLETSLAHYPDNPTLVCQLGQAYLQMGELEKAIEYLRKSAQADPGNMAAVFNLGISLKRSGDLDGALRAYQDGINRFGATEEVILNFGSILSEQGRHDVAHATLARFAVTSEVSADFLERLAISAFRNQDSVAGFTALANIRKRGFSDASTIWAPGQELSGKYLSIVSGPDRLLFLALLPALAELHSRLNNLARGWQISVAADLSRLTEQCIEGIPVNSGGDGKRSDITILVEQIPEILASLSAMPGSTRSIDLFKAFSTSETNRCHIEFENGTVVDAKQAAVLQTFLGGHHRSFQSPDPKGALSILRTVLGNRTTVMKKLIRRWDGLDRIEQIATAGSVVTDDPVLAMLACSTGRRALLIRKERTEKQWSDALLAETGVEIAGPERSDKTS
ncbi:sulfotransferase [Nisaea sp.]|uniref:sulfotransferase n=1 Tax=Nisaea sp. TaxID=2024842 RepID=UPI002B272D05|nr:sulfotransferase [Nisaea sp.]